MSDVQDRAGVGRGGLLRQRVPAEERAHPSIARPHRRPPATPAASPLAAGPGRGPVHGPRPGGRAVLVAPVELPRIYASRPARCYSSRCPKTISAPRTPTPAARVTPCGSRDSERAGSLRPRCVATGRVVPSRQTPTCSREESHHEAIAPSPLRQLRQGHEIQSPVPTEARAEAAREARARPVPREVTRAIS